MGVRFGRRLSHKSKTVDELFELSFKVILNLIKYMQGFVNMFLEFTLKLVLLLYLVNSASFLYQLPL